MTNLLKCEKCGYQPTDVADGFNHFLECSKDKQDNISVHIQEVKSMEEMINIMRNTMLPETKKEEPKKEKGLFKSRDFSYVVIEDKGDNVCMELFKTENYLAAHAFLRETLLKGKNTYLAKVMGDKIDHWDKPTQAPTKEDLLQKLTEIFSFK